MKTTNYQFDLMYQGQEHKDIVYNESILKLDANLNLSVDINFFMEITIDDDRMNKSILNRDISLIGETTI